MARFSIRQLLALTALCAFWLATYSPEVFGVFAHVALGWLLVIGFLAWNCYSISFTTRASHVISLTTTILSSLFFLLLIPIIFQSDTSRRDHWKWFFVCVGYLGIVLSTFAAAEWVRRRSLNSEAAYWEWLTTVAFALLPFGLTIAYLIFQGFRHPLEFNAVLGVVLFNAAYLVAYATHIPRDRKPN